MLKLDFQMHHYLNIIQNIKVSFFIRQNLTAWKLSKIVSNRSIDAVHVFLSNVITMAYSTTVSNRSINAVHELLSKFKRCNQQQITNKKIIHYRHKSTRLQ